MEEEKKVYIGNLEYGVTENDLAKVIEEQGLTATSVTVIMDKFSGRSKGFGFAEFATKEDADKAIESLNGKDLNGRALKVNKAQKMKPREKFGGGGAGGGAGRFEKRSRY